MKKPKVTLTVEGTPYVPVRAVELQRLRAVDKAAREVIATPDLVKPHGRRQLRKLAQAVRS